MFLTGSISPASAVISIVLTAFAVLFALFLLLPLKISLKGFFSSDDIYFDADIGFTGIFKFIPTIKIRSDKILALIGRRLRKKAKSNRNTQAKNEPISQTDKKTENNLSDGSKSDKLRKTQTKKKTYAQCRSEAQIKDKEDKRGFIDFIKNFVKKYYRPYIEPNKKYFIKTCRSILKIIKNFFAK